jgi:hypothetical protein
VPWLVVVRPRQPREARSRTAQTRLRQLASPGDLDPAAGFAEGALDEVGVPDPLVMFEREPQVAGELLAVGEQAADRGRVDLAVLLGERVDAGLHGGHQPLPGFHPGRGEGGGVEDRPVGAADLLLGAGRDLRQEIAAAVKP